MRKTCLAAALAAACFTTASFAADSPQQPGKMASCCSAKDTAGWDMMSADERKMHENRMGHFKDMGSCKAYMEEHHKAMQERAKQKGATISKDSGHGCDHMAKKP